MTQHLAPHFRIENVGLEHLVEARLALEVPMARAAAVRRSEADITRLQEQLQRMEEAETGRDFLHADTGFHEALAAASSNPFFVFGISPVPAVFEETRESNLRVDGARKRILVDHRRPLTAVRAGNAARAEAAMRRHISNFAAASSGVPGGSPC